MVTKKKNTSFRWDSPQLERMVKIACLDQGLTINDYLTKAIKTQLEQEGYLKS